MTKLINLLANSHNLSFHKMRMYILTHYSRQSYSFNENDCFKIKYIMYLWKNIKTYYCNPNKIYTHHFIYVAIHLYKTILWRIDFQHRKSVNNILRHDEYFPSFDVKCMRLRDEKKRYKQKCRVHSTLYLISIR